MSLKAMFPEGRFSPAARETEIVAVETELGVRLPEQLRALYLQCDGFREPIGNAKYLLSLTANDGMWSLMAATKFWWREWPETVGRIYPIDFSKFVFFGSSVGSESWGMRLEAPHNIIAYHHDMEDEIEECGLDIFDVYRRDFSIYG